MPCRPISGGSPTRRCIAPATAVGAGTGLIWPGCPADQAALRARIAASGRTAEEVFAVVEQQIQAEVSDIAAAREHGDTVWPVIDYADIEAATVPAESQALLRLRWLPIVVRGHFERDQALGLGPGHRGLRREQPLL